ncbi:MAG TPA: DHH family phosphoesterase [Spirochaetota bacterium]|jgi:nanoRNase/pAp phosphatase (c-di-AMP/oligoRNAs hydrolase)|nr:MAG: putative manganese-dependent inorganic pyrophosphatase [Spirochaetes bacterium ADurb.Bin133]HNZ27583.1 DHH family phosphoesterase [Spirochaetota bacterium]HPY88551.1 DHH family phosphoesterase [Spirochaetota bacterium]
MLVNQENLKIKFEKILDKYSEFAIIPHYNPDPDALGSSFGLYYLLNKLFNKKTLIFFGGIIGRAENNMMINVLDIPIINLKDDEALPDLPIILMDTQPGTGNNPLTANDIPVMTFDHHPIQSCTKNIQYADIRVNYGSTSTIIYEYYKIFEMKPPVNVATALYYGIQSDVVGEGRTGYKIDFSFMEELSKNINREKLFSIEKPKLPFDYYIHINKGLENGVIYDDFLISSLGDIVNPDYIGEIADLLIRFDKASLVLVMGIYKNTIQLSFRSQKKKIDAGLMLKKIVGNLGYAGGHASNSGGKICLKSHEDIPKISKRIITKSLDLIQGKITTGIPFLSLNDYLKY